MDTPLYVLLSQQDALDRQMAVVAHNIANASTTGFKGQDVLFEDFIKRLDPKNETHFVVDQATLRNTSQGPLVRTENPLDFAISGQGYFPVQTPQGVQYTRQGSFQLDAEGNLVTMDGFKVLGAGNTGITIPSEATQISVGSDGTISTDAGDLGKLQPVRFADEQQLTETYNGFYSTTAAPETDSTAIVEQGMVESSNVNPVAEMTRVIEISRAYQRVANLISSENDRLRNAIRDLGRPV
ncbi:MAG: flagellar basal-body rod protein FlgF [Proteobacteria bacterium]|nr:flagellar basal-body rod protein FlgF [Pseudomonadota bacterium]